MPTRTPLLLLVAMLAGDGFLPAVDVRLRNSLVTIEARNAPLGDVLDRLSQVSGMKVTYEGERPTTPVTVSLDGVSEIDAVPKLLEGLGISYFLRADSSGDRVETLIITGRAASSAPSRMASLQPPPRHYQPEPEERVEVSVEPEDPAKTEAVAAAHAAQGHLDPSRRQMPELDPATGQYVMPAAPGGDPGNPYGGMPSQQFPQSVSYPTP